MKKVVFTVFIMFLFGTFAFAGDKEYTYDQQNEQEPEQYSVASNWTFLQIGIAPYFPGVTQHSNVCGIKLGLPMSTGAGYVNGLELGIVTSGTSHIAGLQLSPILCLCETLYGFQTGLINISTQATYGLQVSAANINSGDAYGLQVSPVNIVEKDANGVQIGAVNYAESANGFQIGVCNMADKCGIQLGLVNVIADGWLPFFPIFNVSF